MKPEQEAIPCDRPQGPMLNGEGLIFTTLEHGGDYPDTMPQAIEVRDAQGRSCIYVLPFARNDSRPG
jgi:hypothetical protein